MMILKKKVSHLISFCFSNDFFQFSWNEKIMLNHQGLNDNYVIHQILAIKENEYHLLNFYHYQFLLIHLKGFFDFKISNLIGYHFLSELHLYSRRNLSLFYLYEVHPNNVQ